MCYTPQSTLLWCLVNSFFEGFPLWSCLWLSKADMSLFCKWVHLSHVSDLCFELLSLYFSIPNESRAPLEQRPIIFIFMWLNSRPMNGVHRGLNVWWVNKQNGMEETQCIVQVKGNAFLKSKVKIKVQKFVDILFLKLRISMWKVHC